MNTIEALRLLGVSVDTLSGSQMNQLDDYGYLEVHDLLVENNWKKFALDWMNCMKKRGMTLDSN